MSDLSDTINEALHETKLRVKLTNKGPLIYNGWSKERLLSLLKDKLVRHHKFKFLPVCTDAQCDASLKLLHSIIHSGIYNECVLLELEGKGMSEHNIMRAMKYGLLSLNSKELKYFHDFGAEIHVIKDADMWTKKLDEKLIWNLIIAGLNENQCWNIVMCGLVSQDESILCRLLSSGVDVPGIFSWPEQIKPVTSTIIRFLRNLGMDEDTLRYVEENGIDDEVEDMLIDLGYNEYGEKEALGEILCECSLATLEALSTVSLLKTETLCSLSKATSSNVSTSVNTQHGLIPFTCKCRVNSLSKIQGNESLKRNDYLRQNVMVPLSWAISRALRYQPSDPKHYIAHQLLRWKYGNVPQEEVHNAQQFVASTTIVMDRRLVEKRKREEDAIRCLNEAAVKNIDCEVCLKRQKSYRIKERCWKCTRVNCMRVLHGTECNKCPVSQLKDVHNTSWQ